MQQANRDRISVYRRLPFLAGLLLLVAAVQHTETVNAHGYMTYPKSRAVDHIEDDTKGWPIAGIKARLRREPCIGLKLNKQLTEVSPGSLRMEFMFTDGANHVGPCYAFLSDPMAPGNRVQIGEAMHCARSDHPGAGQKGQDIPGHMMVTIPDSVPCDPAHCVLQWVWTATHISATNPERYEHYDSCADIRITGAKRENRGEVTIPAAQPLAAWHPDIAVGQGYVQHMITYASVDGGVGNEKAIQTMKDRIEALDVGSALKPGDREQAVAENQQGIVFLSTGRVSDAVRSFEAAYRLVPGDAEIIGNLGYAHFLHNNPQAAEPMLLLALVFEPGRANAWATLGLSFAKRGRTIEAVACFALAYRYSGNRGASRDYFQQLAGSEDAGVRQAAGQALQLQFVRDADN